MSYNNKSGSRKIGVIGESFVPLTRNSRMPQTKYGLGADPYEIPEDSLINPGDEQETDIHRDDYGETILQEGDDKYIRDFLGPTLSGVERIEAAKHKAQDIWDQILTSSDTTLSSHKLTEFIKMQALISNERLLMHETIFKNLQTYGANYKDGKSPDVPGVYDLTGDCHKDKSSITYRKMRYSTFAASWKDQDLIDVQTQWSCKAFIDWDYAHDIFNAQTTEEEDESTSADDLLNKLIKTVHETIGGFQSDKTKDLTSDLKRFLPPQKWNFEEHTKNTDVSRPGWALPTESRVQAGTWTCESNDSNNSLQVMVGGVALTIIKKFYNPRVVDCIKKNILKAAMHYLNCEKDEGFANFVTIDIKLCSENTVHVLSIAPMHTAESCVVSNIHFEQTFNSEPNQNAGILVLPKNIHLITPFPKEEVTYGSPYIFSLCNAYKGVKLNETHLSYVHSINCISALPDDYKIWNAQTDNFTYDYMSENVPGAKINRVSKGTWDIVASSYMINHSTVRTVITVVKYPPNGTQMIPHSTLQRNQGLPHYNMGQTEHPRPPPSSHVYRAEYHRRGHSFQPREERNSGGSLSIGLDFYIRALFPPHIEQKQHLLRVQWRKGTPQATHDQILQQFTDYFMEVKQQTSREIRRVIDDHTSQSDHNDRIRRTAERQEVGVFWKLLVHPNVQKKYQSLWIERLRKWLEPWTNTAHVQSSQGHQFDTCPMAFVADDDDDQETLMELLFGASPDQETRNYEDFVSEIKRENAEQQTEPIITRPRRNG